MKKYSEMNGNEKIAYRNIKNAFEWNVGGWYNCIQDGCEEDIPETEQDAKDMVKDEALNTYYTGDDGASYGRAPKEMRFAGTEFINEVIDYLFETDGDVEALAEAKNWRNNTMKYEVIAMENGEFAVVEAGTNNVYKTYTRKDSARKAANRLNAKEQPATEEQPKVEEPQDETKTEEQPTPETNTVKVELRAFTGMLLGVYEAHKTKKGYKVVTKAGKTLNFNKDGEQIGIKSYSFANKIVFC